MDKLVNNWVRISGIDYIDGVDVSYQDEKYFNLYYTVLGLGAIGNIDCTYADHYRLKETVEVGEKVLLRWYAVSEAYERGPDKQGYYHVQYGDIVGVEREGELVPVNGNIFISSDSEVVTGSGKVISVSSDVDYYIGYDGEKFGVSDVEVGDYVMGNFRDMREVEHLSNQQLNDKVFAVEDKDILMISDKEVEYELY